MRPYMVNPWHDWYHPVLPIWRNSESTPSKDDLVYMTLMGVPFLCRAGRPQFDTEGIAVIMTDRRVLGFPFPWLPRHQLTGMHPC